MYYLMVLVTTLKLLVYLLCSPLISTNTEFFLHGFAWSLHDKRELGPQHDYLLTSSKIIVTNTNIWKLTTIYINILVSTRFQMKTQCTYNYDTGTIFFRKTEKLKSYLYKFLRKECLNSLLLHCLWLNVWNLLFCKGSLHMILHHLQKMPFSMF